MPNCDHLASNKYLSLFGQPITFPNHLTRYIVDLQNNALWEEGESKLNSFWESIPYVIQLGDI